VITKNCYNNKLWVNIKETYNQSSEKTGKESNHNKISIVWRKNKAKAEQKYNNNTEKTKKEKIQEGRKNKED
jgi:hypothetical protein